MEVVQIALIVAYGVPVIGLLLAAGLPDPKPRLGYVFVLLSLTVAVAAIQISRDLWPLILLPGGSVGAVIFRHMFWQHFFTNSEEGG